MAVVLVGIALFALVFHPMLRSEPEPVVAASGAIAIAAAAGVLILLAVVIVRHGRH